MTNKTKILIANLGNRNIKHQRLSSEYINNKSFRDESKSLLDDLESGNENYDSIGVEIIALQLRELGSGDKVVLFYTDQSGVTNATKKDIDQDTLYSGKIIKNWIGLKFPELEVILEPVKCNPSNESEVLKRYRSKFKNIILKNPDSEFWLITQGGTYHQKLSARLCIEFYLDEAQYRLFDNAFNKATKTSKSIELNKDEYKKLAFSSQAIKFAEKGLFEATAELCSQIEDKNFKKAEKIAWQAKNNLRQINGGSFENLVFEIDIADVSNFKPKEKKTCALHLSIAQFYLELENPAEFLLSAHRFMEDYINYFIDRNSKFKLKSGTPDYGEQEANLVKEVNANLQNYEVPAKLFGSEITAGIPLRLLFLSSIAKGNQIISSFLNLNSKFNVKIESDWSSLRNSYTHSGTGFSFTDIENKAPNLITKHFPMWLKSFNLPPTNIFRQSINQITNTLQ